MSSDARRVASKRWRWRTHDPRCWCKDQTEPKTICASRTKMRREVEQDAVERTRQSKILMRTPQSCGSMEEAKSVRRSGLNDHLHIKYSTSMFFSSFSSSYQNLRSFLFSIIQNIQVINMTDPILSRADEVSDVRQSRDTIRKFPNP